MKLPPLLALPTSLLLASSALAQRAYVDVDALGANDGSSWSDAFTDLTAALASGADELWIAEGTYLPDASGGAASATFVVTDGTELHGGFAGTETALAERDVRAHPTVLSGDLLGDDGGISNAADNAYRVVTLIGCGPTTLLDGLTIRAGIGGDDTTVQPIGGVGGAGGGLFLQGSSPEVRDCSILSNRARLGSGVYSEGGSPVFVRCLFSGNRSQRSGEGGAIYAAVDGSATPQVLSVLDCRFAYNSVWQGHFATGLGGAIYAKPGVALIAEDCVFRSNSTWHNGTFGNGTVGGAVLCGNDGGTLRSCEFVGNYSNLGAALYSLGPITLDGCSIVGNRAVAASTCSGFDCPNDVPDVGSGDGGAVFMSTFAGALLVRSSTLANNFAAEGSAIRSSNGGTTIENSILWGNRRPQPCCGEDPVPLSRMQVNGTFDAESTCLEALFVPAIGEDPPDPANYPGCIQDDPLFVVAPVTNLILGISSPADLRLTAASPCRDAGDSTLVPAGLATDLEGLPRIADAAVDMGAYETQSPAAFASYCAGDGSDLTGCGNCPCDNEAPLGSRGGCLNGAGGSAELLASGLPSQAADTLRFELRAGNPDTFAVLISGVNRLPAMGTCAPGIGVPSAFLDGLRCAGSLLLRHGTRAMDSNGDVGATNAGWGGPDAPSIGLIARAGLSAGETRHFQVFYREDPLLGCGRGQNTTNAVTLTILP